MYDCCSFPGINVTTVKVKILGNVQIFIQI